MNNVVIPTGYMGSGSSALTDLIGEFRGYTENHGSFEYIFLHCPDGVFDLEEKLLRNNNAIRSDEAIHSFIETMETLFESRFWWPGNYRANLSETFMDRVYAFVDELVDFTSDAYWYHQERLTGPQLALSLAKRACTHLTRGVIGFPKMLRYAPMAIALPTSEEYYRAARHFLQDIFIDLGIEEHHLLLDQLVLPFNLSRLDSYFSDNAFVFVVQRDPRDVFLLNKYVWLPQGNPVPFPTDVHAFCAYYRRMRDMETFPHSFSHVMRLSFEDLLYRYDDTVATIRKTLGLQADDHVAPRTKLVPEQSLNNTQLFLIPDYRDERIAIERALPEFLYRFPFERVPDRTAMF